MQIYKILFIYWILQIWKPLFEANYGDPNGVRNLPGRLQAAQASAVLAHILSEMSAKAHQ